MKADLTKTAALSQMKPLGIADPFAASGMLESVPAGLATPPPPPGTDWQEIEVGFEAAKPKTIKVLVSKPETFAGRNGYNPDFLDGWQIALPQPPDSSDLRDLRHGGNGHVLNYEHFSTVQSKSRRMPMFVAVNIDGSKKKITRTSTPWRFDGRLDVEDQIGDEVYSEKKNVLDRGHMVRREDPIWGVPTIASRANIDTFHFTNSCPQIASVNQQIWLGLENYILLNARDESLAVSVFTGPVFRKNDMKYRGARIPKSFFKVVAVIADDGRPSATAYEVSQEDELSELEFVFGPYKTFQTSIADIEEKTDLTFGDLKKYDGFSANEAAGAPRARVELESLEMIRI